MAQLLRIQPQAPNPDLRLPQMVPSMGQYAGKALTDLGEELFKLEAGADQANSAKIAGDIKATWDAKVQELNDTITDPKEFKVKSLEAQAEIYDTQIANARSDAARTKVDNLLSNERIALTGKIAHLGQQKTVLKAQGEYKDTEQKMFDYAVATDDPKKREEIIKGFAHFTGQMAGYGFLKPAEAADNIRKFAKSVNVESMTLRARRNPEEFITAELNGEFQGKGIDPLDVQTALNVAGAVSHQKAVRDAQRGKKDSDTVERELERLAENKQLDPWLVEKAARVFGWDTNKKTGLLNMQLGIRAAPPFEAKLIDEAMEPARRNIRYTMQDLDEADRKLKQHVKEGVLSSSTSEYRAARDHLQAMARSLRIEGNMDRREAEFDARRDLQVLYRKIYPGKRDEDIQSEVNDHLMKLSKLKTAAEHKQYIRDLEKRLETGAKTAPVSGGIQADKLRGALKKPGG